MYIYIYMLCVICRYVYTIIIIIVIFICHIHIYIYIYTYICLYIYKHTVSFHNFNSHNFTLRVSNPRAVAYSHFSMPFESSNLPGSGRTHKTTSIRQVVTLYVCVQYHLLIQTTITIITWTDTSIDYGRFSKVHVLYVPPDPGRFELSMGMLK